MLDYNLIKPTCRDAPIFPARFLEKYVGKRKEQYAGKIGENWDNGHQGMATWDILYDKDRDTLIKQSCIVLGQHILIGNGD